MITINEKEYPIVDIGCGDNFQEGTDIGLDIYKYNDKIKICNVGFERIPFEDNSVGRFMAKDFIEHLPPYIYHRQSAFDDPADLALYYPIIEMMNEVYRCLVPGGEFESWTPMHPCQEVYQDPTHKSVMTMNTMDYYCDGEYGRLPEGYGIKSKFKKIINEQVGFHLHSLLRK